MGKRGKLILLICAALIVGFVVYMYSINNKATSSNITIKSDNEAKNDNSIAKNKKDDAKADNANNVNNRDKDPKNKNNSIDVKSAGYDPLKIVGISTKLSKSQSDSMNKWRESILEISKNNRDSVFIDGRTNEKLVALTFDDGPDGKVTPQILKMLKENNIKASFFFIGERVKAYPSVVKQAFDDGNLVLNHSYTHPQLTKENETQIKQEILSTENEIFKIINKKPAIIRPPYGDVNDLVINVCNKLQYKAVIWSIDSMDWANDDENIIIKNIIDNIRPGDIILMHSTQDKARDIKVLSLVIPKLKEDGYRFVELDEMLKIKPYKD